MSEFSESYHLVGKDRREGIALLTRAGLSGYVYPAINDWITLLPSGPIYTQNEELIANNHGMLLYYAYAEDHGWSFSLYEGDKLICRYDCSWDEEIVHDVSELHAERLLAFINSRPGRQQDVTDEQLMKALSITDFEELFEQVPAYQFAQWLGLTHYEWQSHDYIERDFEESLDYITDSGVVKV
ncbi:hypothetical protein [Paenibacillus montanisoli]|uniref:Uncharacterized protein n=1 Tax=Paenibacillus montanisoli TaxID=2081970 RepID=A0A328U2Y3_9BACL|nr:hypothetical protein [Paenibacillus montanisoli]RAP76143.1 hypothetical protein DL346_12055 [Paenibacillus montanisoli]